MYVYLVFEKIFFVIILVFNEVMEWIDWKEYLLY